MVRGRFRPVDEVHQVIYDVLRKHCVSSERFAEFCSVCLKGNSEGAVPEGLLKLGMLRRDVLLALLTHEMTGPLRMNNQFSAILDALFEWDCFLSMSFVASNALVQFQINFAQVAYYESRGVLENIVKGLPFMLERHSRSVVAILTEGKGQDGQMRDAIGSGSIVRWGTKTLLLTNRHVVDPEAECVKGILAGGDRAIAHADLQFKLSDTDDLAACEIEVDGAHPAFSVGETVNILQEVFLLGYPKIAQSDGLVLTTHSGEINADFRTYFGEALYLISNYASPGSSGGPLIDRKGELIGVVAQRLEAEYDDLKQKVGLFQHSAAVTLERVRTFLLVNF